MLSKLYFRPHHHLRLAGMESSDARTGSPARGRGSKEREPGRSASIGLLDMGRCTRDTLLRVVAANLQTVFNVRVDMPAPLPVPEETLEPLRGQYDAGLILKHLSGLSFHRYSRILAITDVDLCSPILTYVFGQAQIGAKLGIVSDFRLKHICDGGPAPSALYYERVVKVALHEIGHTLSLYHCENPGCLMQTSTGTGPLDELSIGFCARCDFVLRRTLSGFRNQ